MVNCHFPLHLAHSDIFLLMINPLFFLFFSFFLKVQRALENVAKQKKAGEMRADATQKTRMATTGQNPRTEMKGIPKELLERVLVIYYQDSQPSLRSHDFLSFITPVL